MKATQPTGKDDIQIPPAFLVTMQELLAGDYPSFLSSILQTSTTGIRINPLKISTLNFEKISPWNLNPVDWCSTGYTLPPDVESINRFPPGKHPYHAAGLYYLQEPSAMAPVEFLDPQPGDRVLDLAAAPGGKTTQIVSRMENTGLLVANEIHPRRVWALAENLERWGARNTIILNENPDRLLNIFSLYFDRILLDAPCSGEGMFRKSASAREDWSPEHVRKCATRQSDLLEKATKMLRPGGILVYSTCTFSPLENEAVIAEFLNNHPEFSLLECPSRPGFMQGRPDWAGAVRPEIALQLERTVRLWPHKINGDGHFIARLQRIGWPSPGKSCNIEKAKIPPEQRKVFQEFCKTNLRPDVGFDPLLVKGSYLYQAIPGAPDLSGLHVIHPGWWLGSFRQSRRMGTIRFEPAHALALGLSPRNVNQTINLDLGAAVRYLRGESIIAGGTDGWVLICVDSHPIGWGKRNNGVIKNDYPKGLRWT